MWASLRDKNQPRELREFSKGINPSRVAVTLVQLAAATIVSLDSGISRGHNKAFSFTLKHDPLFRRNLREQSRLNFGKDIVNRDEQVRRSWANFDLPREVL